MYSIIIRFYEELNDFLPKSRREKMDMCLSFQGKRSIKDLIESIGVPHVEVDLILVNSEPVSFSYIVKDGDRISVYPVFETLSIDGVTHLRETSLRDTKFVLDVHLRKLARRMRLLGFDVDYENDRDDPELAMISYKENRILLTRDRQLLKRRNVSRGLVIRNKDPELQIEEVIERLDLWSVCRPFSRCMECNGDILKANLEDNYELMKKRIPEGVLSWCREFHICSSCDKIYWRGSHYEKLRDFVDKIMAERR